MRKLLFSVTKKDVEIFTFCSGGPGGQHQNKVATGARVLHPPSGAVGEARDSRSQHDNIRAAFKRMGNSRKFQTWARIKAAEILDSKTADERVDELMDKRNILTEIKDEHGRWIKFEIKEE